MKRRTMLQSLLALLGLPRVFCASETELPRSGWFKPFLERVELDCRSCLASADKPSGYWSISVSGVFGQPSVVQAVVFWEKVVREQHKCSTRSFFVLRSRDEDSSRARRLGVIRDAVSATIQEMLDPEDFDDVDYLKHDYESISVEI